MEVKPGYQRSIMGVIPMDWKCTTVGQLVSAGVIEKPLDGNHGNIHPKSSDFVSYGIPFVMANNIKGGHIDFGSCAFIRKKQADSLQKGFSITGDVLLTHKATIGHTALVVEIPFEYIMLTPQVTYYRIADPTRLNNLYLRHFFDSAAFQNVLLLMSGGGTRSYIGITAQLKLPVVIPSSKNEQELIAEALGDADALIESLEQLIAKKRDIKQAAVQELLTGKKRLPGFVRENGYKKTEMGLVPEDWTPGYLGDFIKEMTDFVASGSFESLRNNVRVYGSPNFALYVRLFDLRLGLGHLAQKYVDEGSCKFLSKSNLYGNEILISNIGANVGEAFLMPSNLGPATIAPNMIVVRTDNGKLTYDYLYQYVKSGLGQERIKELIAGSGQPKINKTDLKRYKVVVPSINEQIAITIVLSQMDGEIAVLEKKLDKTAQLKQGMMQELLTGRIRLV